MLRSRVTNNEYCLPNHDLCSEEIHDPTAVYSLLIEQGKVAHKYCLMWPSKFFFLLNKNVFHCQVATTQIKNHQTPADS